jgi:hypothetical protein
MSGRRGCRAVSLAPPAARRWRKTAMTLAIGGCLLLQRPGGEQIEAARISARVITG